MKPIDVKNLVLDVDSLTPLQSQVLQALKPRSPIAPSKLASELYVLPFEVKDAMIKLRNLDFITECEPSAPSFKVQAPGEPGLVLTEVGEKARTLATFGIADLKGLVIK